MLPDSAPIDKLPWPKNNLRVRILNALKWESSSSGNSLATVGWLREMPVPTLMRTPNLGRKSVRLIVDVLAADRARIDLEQNDFGDLWVA